MPQKRHGKKEKHRAASRQEPMSRKTDAGKEPTIADVDFDNPGEKAAYIRELQRKAGVNIRTAVQKLRDAGIIDERGKRIRKELPPDMRPGSRCQVPR
jgi:hypothetical protein